jgi:hypothetical protein
MTFKRLALCALVIAVSSIPVQAQEKCVPIARENTAIAMQFDPLIKQMSTAQTSGDRKAACGHIRKMRGLLNKRTRVLARLEQCVGKGRLESLTNDVRRNEVVKKRMEAEHRQTGCGS